MPNSIVLNKTIFAGTKHPLNTSVPTGYAIFTYRRTQMTTHATPCHRQNTGTTFEIYWLYPVSGDMSEKPHFGDGIQMEFNATVPSTSDAPALCGRPDGCC